MSVCQLRPTSRGHLKARSKDMTMPPEIVLNYFATEEDRRVMIAGVRLAQDIARSKGMSDYVAAPYLPSRFLETDREIEDFIRETATTIFHPVGTCRIGHDDMAVVDPRLRVHGVSGLRVVDASVMPTVPSGNTNAASIAIGEYASDIIKSDRLMRNADNPARGRGTDRESRHLSR
jgi:choline dehydrogenase